MVDLSIHGRQILVDLCFINEYCSIIQSVERLRILTFLSDKFNKRNKSDIGPGRHWVVEENAAMPYGAFIPQ